MPDVDIKQILDDAGTNANSSTPPTPAPAAALALAQLNGPTRPPVQPVAPEAAPVPVTPPDRFGMSWQQKMKIAATMLGLPTPPVSANPTVMGSIPLSTAAQPATPVSVPSEVTPAAPQNTRQKIGGLIETGLQNFGDVAAASGARGGVEGAAKVAQAHVQRLVQQKKDQIAMATANAQMLHEQALTRQMGFEAMSKSADSGKAAVDAIIKPVAGGAAGTVDFTDKTPDELKKLIDSKQLDPTKQTAFLTGVRVTGQDAEGLPTYDRVYTVVTPAGNVRINPDNAKIINEALSMHLPVSENEDEQQMISGVQLNNLLQQAYTARSTRLALMSANATAQEKIDQEQINQAAATFTTDPKRAALLGKIYSAVGMKPLPDGGIDPLTQVKAYNYIKGHPDVEQQLDVPNFDKVWIQAHGGDKAWDKLLADYDKQQDKLQTSNTENLDEFKKSLDKPNAFDETNLPTVKAKLEALAIQGDPGTQTWAKNELQIAAAAEKNFLDLKAAEEQGKKDADKKFQGDPKLKGDAYLATLKPDERTLVEEVGTGRMTLARLDYLMARNPDFLVAVANAYPDSFDASKAQAYPATYKDFTAGATARAINAGATALETLTRLYNNTNAASLLPGTKAYRDREADINTAANEGAKFLVGGTAAASEKDIEHFRATIDPTLPINRNEGVVEMLRNINNKIDQYKQQWTNAAPSKYYQAPMPGISQAALNQVNQILGNKPAQPAGAGKVLPQTLKRPDRFPTATGTTTVNGQLYWSDIQKKPLGPLNADEMAIVNAEDEQTPAKGGKK